MAAGGGRRSSYHQSPPRTLYGHKAKESARTTTTKRIFLQDQTGSINRRGRCTTGSIETWRDRKRNTRQGKSGSLRPFFPSSFRPAFLLVENQKQFLSSSSASHTTILSLSLHTRDVRVVCVCVCGVVVVVNPEKKTGGDRHSPRIKQGLSTGSKDGRTGNHIRQRRDGISTSESQSSIP